MQSGDVAHRKALQQRQQVQPSSVQRHTYALAFVVTRHDARLSSTLILMTLADSAPQSPHSVPQSLLNTPQSPCAGTIEGQAACSSSGGMSPIKQQSASLRERLSAYRRLSIARPCEVCNVHVLSCRRQRFVQVRLTKMLVTITSLYLLMNIPNYYIRINNIFISTHDRSSAPLNDADADDESSYKAPGLYDAVSESVHEQQKYKEVILQWQHIAFMLYYAHYALLFYFYVFWSPDQKSKMRRFATRLVQCYCLMPDAHKEYVKEMSKGDDKK